MESVQLNELFILLFEFSFHHISYVASVLLQNLS